jgi:integration host factor subunit alpha
MALTKECVVDSIHDQLDLLKTESTALIESFLETIKQSLENGEDVLISGFVKFCVKDKNEWRGRKPQSRKG